MPGSGRGVGPQAVAVPSEEGRKYTVAIRTDLGGGMCALGTGSVIRDHKVVVVTAAHVVKGGRGFFVAGPGTGWLPARLLGADYPNDVAALEVDREFPSTTLTDSTDGRLVQWGFSGTPQMTPRVGTFVGRIANPRGFWMSVPARQGDSGAGVFCGDKVCGVLVATDDRHSVVISSVCVRDLFINIFGRQTPRPQPTPVQPQQPNIPSTIPLPGKDEIEKTISRLEAENQRLQDRMKAIQEAADRKLEDLRNEFVKLRDTPLHLDVIDDYGQRSTTSGTLGGKRFRLKFDRVEGKQQ